MRVWIVVLCLLCVGGGRVEASPSQIHLSWQGRTDSTVTVGWRSSAKKGEVEYGPNNRYGKSVQATSLSYGNSYLHQAELSGLAAGALYHYRCGQTGDWSADLTFQTSPLPGKAFRFAVMGDSHGNDSSRTLVRTAVQASKPAFVLHTGDLVDSGKKQNLWDQWFTTMMPLISGAPLMPVLGEHEEDSSLFYKQFALPKHKPTTQSYQDEAYYSFDYGNVHFVALNTEPVGDIGGPQYRWLKEDLRNVAADKDIRWVIVYGHRPPYSSGSYGDSVKIQETWVHLFESLGVDLTLWGHDHFYERTKPLFHDQVVSQGGITYIVTGGGGAALTSPQSMSRTALAKKAYHFLDVQVDSTKVTVKAKGTNGAAFDTLTLSKKAPKPRWIMDGLLDRNAHLVASDPQGQLRSLYVGFDGRYLYVATEGMPSKNDHFILVSQKPPTGQVAAPWGKKGKVWAFDHMLVMESRNGWSTWQKPSGDTDHVSMKAANPAGLLLEGSVDLVGKWGTVPQKVYLAAVAYGTQDKNPLVAQLPLGNKNGDVESGEWYAFDLTVAEPPPAEVPLPPEKTTEPLQDTTPPEEKPATETTRPEETSQEPPPDGGEALPEKDKETTPPDSPKETAPSEGAADKAAADQLPGDKEQAQEKSPDNKGCGCAAGDNGPIPLSLILCCLLLLALPQRRLLKRERSPQKDKGPF